MNNFTFGNDTHQYYETICGGTGAGPDFDGTDAVQAHMTNSRLTDPEVLEMAATEADVLKEKLDSLFSDIKLELLPKDETELADAVVAEVDLEFASLAVVTHLIDQ